MALMYVYDEALKIIQVVACAVYSLAEKNTGPAEGKGLMVTTLPACLPAC